jgi:outer membrane biosynthesis protein TonB
MAELFDRFEINRTPRWPLMSRLVALSLVAHGLFLVAVVYVPTLRSLLYVASNVSGIKFVSEDYDPTLIGQRATIVKLEPHEKLYYPPDYFGAPEVAETTQLDAMVIEQPPPMPPPAPVYRPRRPRVTTPAEPTPEPSPTPDEVAQATPSPSPSPLTEEEKKAEAEMARIAKETGVARPPGNINTKPFEDIAVKGKELFDQGKLKLDTAIDVTATGALNEDGTLKPETVKIDWGTTPSDQNTADLAQQLITAMSQSKVLVVLKGAKDVRISLKLDQQTVKIAVVSDLPTETEAMNTALGCSALVAVGRKVKQGTNEGILYENLKFESAGKQFAMNFEMPKDAAGKMITEMLAKKANKTGATAAATPQARS